jgi:hypothetical protein
MKYSMRGRPLKQLAAVFLAVAATISLGPITHAQAQDTFPNKPIRMAVPFPPGGVSDAAARLVAEAMSRRLRQPVVVENRPGATGNVAGQFVATAEPDGYTMMLAYNGILTINPFVFDKLPFV